MELEIILPYIFIGILLTFSFLIRSEKQFRKLDNELKLKIIEVNFYTRKIYFIGVICIVAFLYIANKLKLFDINVPFAVSILLLGAIVQLLSNKRIERLGIPKTYTKNFKIRMIIMCILAAVAYFYIPGLLPPTAYELDVSAKNKYEKKEYTKAIELFSESIQLDSTDSYCFYNRGLCKLAVKDLTGACEDWHHAEKMGHPDAAADIQNGAPGPYQQNIFSYSPRK